MTRPHPPALTPVNQLLHPPAHTDSRWSVSLSDGAPGILLLHVERARTGHGQWATAHAWATAATRVPVTVNPTDSLFRGAPALAFALHIAGNPAYADALNALDKAIKALTRCRLAAAHTRIDHGNRPTFTEYDLISGLAGIGRYFLDRHPDGPEIRDVLSYLVRLAEPLHVAGETLPGWWTETGPSGRLDERFPGGHANLSLAHGITGPLALVALAMQQGITVPGQTAAIDRICAWLDTWRQGDGTSAWWPPWVTKSEHRRRRCAQAGPFRPSWCYGTPGLARALQLAGQATGDTARQRAAENALLGCVSDPAQLGRLTDTSLCHGWAGLLQTLWRTSTDAQTPELNAYLPQLRGHLRHLPFTDGAGLLEGHAGSALALHTVTGAPPRPRWDSCLLLA
jgi:lantibiotic biosynthesis protein